MKIKQSLALLVLGAILFAPVMAKDQGAPADPGIPHDISLSAAHDTLQSELRKLAAGAELTVHRVWLDKSVGRGAQNQGNATIQSTSCTASATVSVPGLAEVTISATASTCEEAVAMVIAGVRALLESG